LEFLFAFTALSQTLPQGVRKITAVEGITEYALPNGLHVLLFPDSSKPNVTVNMTYMVGSRHEGYGETGMAHLLEHMLFLQTKTRKDVKQELKDHGAEMNGSTDWDRTNYFEPLNSSDENLKFALELEADRMVNSRIEKPLLDTEMTVVRNEFEMGENSPDRMLTQRALETAYTWHNYGKLPIGNRSDIENVPIQKLASFYQKYYQPDNALLTIARKFDDAKTLAQVAPLFGAIPKPSRTLEKSYTVEPTQDGERSITLRRVGDTQGLVAIYHVPAGSHPDAAALEVLAGDLSEYFSQGDWRLMFLMRDRIKAVTEADVLRVAKAYLKESNRTLASFIPTKSPDRAEIPATPDIAETLKDFKGSAVVAAGEAFDPSPSNIESRVVRSTLPGGLKMSLLSRKTRGGTVVASVTIRFGDEKALFGKAATA